MGVQLDRRRAHDASTSTRAAIEQLSSRRTSWSRPCAPRSWCWARWSRASARPKCRCPAAARSARARSTCTSRACRRWAPTSRSRTATSRRAPKRLKGARIVIDMVTVTGTENIMMAAALAQGTTVHRERGAGTRGRRPRELPRSRWARRSRAPARTRIVIDGVDRLHGSHYDVLPDRIETGTFLVAGAMTGGRVIAEARARRHARRGAGTSSRRPARTSTPATDSIELDMRGKPPEGGQPHHRAVPGVPDRHAGAVHRAELRRRRRRRDHRDDLREPLHARAASCSAWARTSASKATPRSSAASSSMTGAPIMATDLRASASLVLAGLVAEGETIGRPHLPHRSRLREHRGEARRASARRSAACRLSAVEAAPSAVSSHAIAGLMPHVDASRRRASFCRMRSGT